MFSFQTQSLLVGLVILVGLASPALAFGAGNIASISKVEGQNCAFPLGAASAFILIAKLTTWT